MYHGVFNIGKKLTDRLEKVPCRRGGSILCRRMLPVYCSFLSHAGFDRHGE